MEADSDCVERGLYVCENCELVANSDLNAAENMRTTVTPNLSQNSRTAVWPAIGPPVR